MEKHYLIFNGNTLDGFVEYVDQYGNFFVFETEEEEVSRYIGDEILNCKQNIRVISLAQLLCYVRKRIL